MKSRAFIALLLLFLWTFVPGMNVACGAAPTKTCSPAERCSCCEDKPCLCKAPAPDKEERPVATPSPELKIPLILPSEPRWDAVPVEVPVVPQLAAPAASVAAATSDVQTRFCTFLL